ncbi:hypothetical protein HJ093_22415 [Vibrio parahaemolyticus]|uniref:hypothetical protein n=1 Tax=Vibrio parahaemolyticus TaxID=670 RepID=UPI00084ABC40|nr:hypothetical protein [Vibrio parahaemolyticus]MBE4195947.1 hypothetical protein [Vibrio parahaemolyticus]MDG2637772.1 hypothetical protein [Vibrio parahaemolyticus]ODZ32288.1 hypothetical protein BBM37_16050 [Vibrio parahaemolyticus]ODZ38354.1 hypothetical protein BBM38_06620 [Vibrio parahaemolyticus]OHX57226.1 hypothetical protein BBZ60_08685 [Vibrio parahaemolyticus]
MPVSPEHQFIAKELDSILSYYSRTKLLGVLESERKKFDYSCMIERDFKKALSSQVLWSHTDGVYKDLVTLLHEQNTHLKVYFVKDTVKHRMRVSEVILEYKNNPVTSNMLRGLRVIYLPADFDADKEVEQRYMSNIMSNLICKDLLFGAVFGQLSSFDVKIFSNHGGPFGLKYTVLDEITKNGLLHTPSFKESIGYSTTGTLREVTTMLCALGLVKRVDNSVMLLPTMKGRMFLDYTKRLVFYGGIEGSNKEIDVITDILTPVRHNKYGLDYINELKKSALYAQENFERDIDPVISDGEAMFYEPFSLDNWKEPLQMMPELEKLLLSEIDA